jgi:hypothetical protein
MPVESAIERLYPIARDLLLNAVRTGRDGMMSYTQFCEELGIDVRDAGERATLMSPLLCLISRRENEAARPLLSAVVYGRANNEPGPGFDELRRELGMLKPRDITTFWTQELKRVHQYWLNH